MTLFDLLPESADAVFALHSLHHVPDIDGALRRITAMLREGGVLALDEHFQENERNSLLRAWPDAAEYVTLVAQKRAEPPRGPALTPPLGREAQQEAQQAAYHEELARLQQLLATKNEHIRRLEGLPERISIGRLMRLMNWVRKK